MENLKIRDLEGARATERLNIENFREENVYSEKKYQK